MRTAGEQVGTDSTSAGALVSPAIAKWQFVEEKMRAVLDAFCHREVRPLRLGAGDDLARALQDAHATPGAVGPTPSTAEDGAYVRSYCIGPMFAGKDAGDEVPGAHRQIAAATFGPADAALDAETCSLALTLLREAGLPAARLHLDFLATPDPAGQARVASIADLLAALGIHIGRGGEPSGTAAPLPATVAFVVTLADAHATDASQAVPAVLARGNCAVPAPQTTGKTPWSGFVVDLHRVIAALVDDAAGYEPVVSVLVAADGSPHAVALALSVAQGLRQANIRTDLVHVHRGINALVADATARGARLLISVGPSDDAPTPDDASLTLINLANGASEGIDLDDLERKIAQLLD